jgi:hypothetical protein
MFKTPELGSENIFFSHFGNRRHFENLKITFQFLEHIFKKMGSTEIVVSSVRPSVRLSVRPSPISQPL